MKNRVSLTLFIFSLLSLSLLNSCDLLNRVFRITKEVPQENPLTGKSLGGSSGTSLGDSSGTSLGGSSGTSLGGSSRTSLGGSSRTSLGGSLGTSSGGSFIDRILAIGTLWVEEGNPRIPNKRAFLIEGNNQLCNQLTNNAIDDRTNNAVELHMHCRDGFNPYTIKNSNQFSTSGKTYTVTSSTTITGNGVTLTLVPTPTIAQMIHPSRDGLWVDYQNAFPSTSSLSLASHDPLHATVFYFKNNNTVCRTEISSPSERLSILRSSCSPTDFHPYTIDNDTHMTIEGVQYERTSAITFSSGNHNFFPLAVYY